MTRVEDLAEPRRPTQNVLELVRAALPDLRKSDAKVAAVVLAEPFGVLESTISEMAERAGVSQPTVIRFCVAIGFSGFQEFKLRLAHSLALGRPATHSVILDSDNPGAVADKIFDYTLTSLDWARQHLDRQALNRAVAVLAGAQSIEFFGYGASGIVAMDGQQKFPLFGVPCRAQSDSHQQIMTASMMKPGDVAVVISNTGSNRQLAEAAQVVRDSGAQLIGIVGAEGIVSALCDVTLIVETLDNTSVYTPTISRIAALVVIDILSTAVAMRRGEDHIARLSGMKRRLNTFRSGETEGNED
ncbi:MurR/RpiR family transcriptional regulator [Lichenifustis flavocetrariae]|uniref:MurR/RpiR family transcriptional regulator n=1 Tax=Lichenifustis flavocetrariae TaxID=2949735 RepID=A0AA41Z1Q3_9HYPH|nr:MurR/RpiR family transcriptional regulator [Lichenifustis flavocetrariae]MCW6508888.1 MurR/RpiR family transcriptional regulator [Lichenifustis flavocetrariae]